MTPTCQAYFPTTPCTPKATLWECEELALRNVLEDGKLNLCLRNLVDYKTYELETAGRGGAGAAAAGGAATEITGEQRDTMDKFEKGLGMVLRNAWRVTEPPRFSLASRLHERHTLAMVPPPPCLVHLSNISWPDVCTRSSASKPPLEQLTDN